MRPLPLRRLVLAAILALLASLAPGCAQQQRAFDVLDERDRLRFAACRDALARNLCPGDPDCDRRAAELFTAEPPRSRLRFLLDYRCPRETIERADRVQPREDRRSLGVE